MASLTVGPAGEIDLPNSVRERYGFNPKTRVRIVETQSGILLVPLTDDPPAPELAEELEAWQSAGAASWQQFSFEE